jgi:hypothetical protein
MTTVNFFLTMVKPHCLNAMFDASSTAVHNQAIHSPWSNFKRLTMLTTVKRSARRPAGRTRAAQVRAGGACSKRREGARAGAGHCELVKI